MIFIMGMLFYPQMSMNVQQVMQFVRQGMSAWTHWAATTVFVPQVSQVQSVRQVSDNRQAHAHLICSAFYESKLISF